MSALEVVGTGAQCDAATGACDTAPVADAAPDPYRGDVITMYSTPWCGYCHRLKRLMSDADIAFVDIDIEQDDEAAAFVMSRNAGDQTVPTLLFADGSTMTNPSLRDVQAKVADLVDASGASSAT